MPIKVSCQCGQSFAANDQLAGKRVKCPKCGNAIAIPAPKQPAKPPTAPSQRPSAAQKPRQASQNPPAPSGGSSLSDLFDEAGVTAKVEGRHCPECGSDMAANAVVCIHCGFHRELGRKLAGVAQDEFASDAHSSIAAETLRRAAAALEKSEEEAPVADHKDDNPWMAWLFLLFIPGILIFVFFAVFGIGGNALSGVQLAMKALFAGELLLAYAASMDTIALSLGFLSWIFVSVAALQKSKIHGVACLLTCVYAPIYGLINWSTCKQGMSLWVASWHVSVLGACSVIAFALFGAGSVLAGLGFFVLYAGLATLHTGWLLTTLAAYENEKELVHGLISTLIFPYAYVYGLLNFAALKTQVIILLVGTAITIGGGVAVGVGYAADVSMLEFYQQQKTPPQSLFEPTYDDE